MDPKTGEVAAIEKTQAAKPIEEKKVELTARNKAIAEIARRREAERKEEIESVQFDTMDEDGNITSAPPKSAATGQESAAEADASTTSEQSSDEAVQTQAAEPAEEPPKDADSQTSAAPSADTTDAPAEQPADEERELIVDGKRIKVPLSKIIDAGVRTYQKETAADMRLAAASELERQARERIERFGPPKGDQQQQPQPSAQPQPSDDDAALAKAIQFGTEEEARNAVAKLRSAGRGTSQQELSQFVSNNLANALPQYLAFHEANKQIRQDYKQIFSDPDLSQMFMHKEEQARRSGDARPFLELYTSIAEDMAAKFNLKAQPAAETAKVEQQTRVIRKAQSPRPVATAAGRPAPQPEKKPMTTAEYVAKQRQLRGLQPRENQGI